MLGNKSKVSKATKRKLIASSISLFFSIFLVVAVTVSYGWFSSNQEVQARGMAIRIEADQTSITTISCYAYKYDGIYGAVAINVDENNNIEMSEYDKIFQDRNINTPLIIRVEVDGVSTEADGQIIVKVPCTGKYSNSQTNDMACDVSTGSTEKILNKLSNVLYVKVGCGLYDSETQQVVKDEYDPTQSSSTTPIYSGARDRFNLDGNYATTEYSFVDVSDHTKENLLEIPLPYSSYSSFIDTQNNNSLVFYIEYNYSSDLVNDFIVHGYISEGEERVVFTGDLGTIYIS